MFLISNKILMSELHVVFLHFQSALFNVSNLPEAIYI